MRGLRSLFVILAAVALSSCASYSSRVEEPRRNFERGLYDFAVSEFKELVERNDNDQLLYLMDLGLVYHTAGRYTDAIETFLKAEKVAELKDYTSITQEAGSVVFSDEVKPYKGEDFEKILINVYLAIDYTLLHKWEDALVECRRVNHKLDMLIAQGAQPYDHNAFAKYLAASLFEARNELNDAFVDYRTVAKWVGSFPYLGSALLRMSDRLRASQEFSEFRAQYPGENKFKVGKNEGQIILLLEQGNVPIKVPHPNFNLIPHFQKRSYGDAFVYLSIDNGAQRIKTFPLFDIENTAIRELDQKIAKITAKKIGGVVVKEVIADQVAKQTNSEALGLLTSFVLHATDSADLRSWSTLPARLQLARAIVPAGRHDLTLDMVSSFGAEQKAVKRWTGVEVKPGETVFLDYRSSR